MSIALDGFKVLRRLGESPDAFVLVRADADKAARALVVKCLKAKSTDLRSMRAIQEALGNKQFELLIDGMTDAELKALLAKIDKHHPDHKTMSPQTRRQHLLALMSGSAGPSAPVTKAPKAKKAASRKAAKETALKRLQSDVMDLFRARGKAKED